MQYAFICILFKCVLTIVLEGSFCGGILKRTASIKDMVSFLERKERRIYEKGYVSDIRVGSGLTSGYVGHGDGVYGLGGGVYGL